MSDPFQRRRRALMRLLKSQEIDLLAVSHPVNVTYLTGFTGDSSWVLLDAHRAILVSDGRYEVQIAEECSGLDVVIRKPDRTIVQAVADTLIKAGANLVGLEAGHLTLGDAEKLRDLAKSMAWKPTTGLVEALRRIKDAGEVERIRQAIAIAERAGHMFQAMLGPADTEKSLVDAMEAFVRRAGGKCTAFSTLVGIGNRSALPHVPPTNRRVDESSFLLLDWGAKETLYHSDLTRMIVTGRPVESRLPKLYTTVLQAQAVAMRRIRAGVRAADVDRAVRAYLEKQGVHEQFNHGLGHGLGLQIHEGPFMRPNSEDVLEAGMVVTVEPGVYFPEWGGVRIEDDVLVTPDGCEILTSMPKDVDSVFGSK